MHGAEVWRRSMHAVSRQHLARFGVPSGDKGQLPNFGDGSVRQIGALPSRLGSRSQKSSVTVPYLLCGPALRERVRACQCDQGCAGLVRCLDRFAEGDADEPPVRCQIDPLAVDSDHSGLVVGLDAGER